MTALAVDTTVFHQLLVELLQIVGSQLGELDIADAGNRVLLDHQMVAVCCGNSHIRLCIDIIPASQPYALCQCALLRHTHAAPL